MNVKKQIINELNNKTEFNSNYKDIKYKVDTSQYICNKKRNVQFGMKTLISFIMIILIFSTIFYFSFSEPKVKYIDSDIDIPENDKVFVDGSEYVFIGKINQKEETKQYKGKGTDIPYTFYSVEYVHFLKGELLSEDSKICFYGGEGAFNTIELLTHNDEVLIEEEYYLFLCNDKTKNSTNDRIGENDYIINCNFQKKLLNNYDPNKTFDEQNDNITLLINRYKNIIEKNIGNDKIDIPSFSSNKEMASYFDYVLIIEVNELYLETDISYGENSDIVSCRYNINSFIFLKQKDENVRVGGLYCYGVNFWSEDLKYKNYVNELEDGCFYLLFANQANENANNSRIREDDFIVMDNYQIIKLEDFDINKSYKNQENIMSIISKYIDID